ncbi:hypothetical protein Htur_4779 (plasmid) [Haloterrigena turkmenica DSM 5511]|uniref:DUF7260 domain-containing protein n=1 Tax=Haloterrigena turkmenica (strain ATCC 51198 / DSM 5511 / JCM 9101 / NCIMB 13204 / VKM B-1734 / 4k) TaxID=543526 RepID=D2S2F4_HALTV|nr:hypothetical protein Htur_4779 [Haloterrigena turkmenica DSM 5511]
MRTVEQTIRGVVALGVLAVAVLVVTSSGPAFGRPTGGGHGTALVASSLAIGGYFPAATRAVEREREQLQRECEAFDRFASTVKSITVQTDSRDGVSTVLVGNTTATGSNVSDVRDAYRATVMDVDHYESEYGEELYENMTLELSENVASAVANGYQFSQPLKQAVIQQSRLATSRRESLLDAVDAERDALERSRNRLREIDETVAEDSTGTEDDSTDAVDRESDSPLSTYTLTELFEYERRLQRCLSRYEQLHRDRQHEIHSNDASRSKTGYPFLQLYLYESLEADFPVLAAVTERCERLRARRDAVRRAITYR